MGNSTCITAYNSILSLAVFFSVTFLLRTQIVHTRGIQLVPELLLLISDALHTQYIDIETMHEGI